MSIPSITDLGRTVGSYIRETAQKTGKNVKTYVKNNTTFGRMYAFNESFGQAWVNTGRNFFAETSTFINNLPAKNVAVKFGAGIREGLTGKKTDLEEKPVQSPVKRLEYEM